MPVADFFVKTDGNDGSAGTTWATAKATVQAGINLITTSNKILAIAPGQYNEALTNPTSAGASDNWNEMVGDTMGVYEDAGANTHGLDPNGVWIYKNATNTLSWSANHNYWRLRNLHFFATESVNGISITSAPDEFQMYDVYAFGDSYGIIIFFNAGSSSTTTENHIYYRCVGIGGSINGWLTYTGYTALPASPIAQYNYCAAMAVAGNLTTGGENYGFAVGGGATNRRTYVEMNNCSGFSYHINASRSGGEFSSGIGARNSNYGKIDATRCWGEGYYGIRNFNAGSSFTDCYGHGVAGTPNDTGVNALADMAHHILPPPILVPGGLVNDVLSDFSGTLSGEEVYDLQGNLLAQTPGAQEFIDGETRYYAPAGFEHDDNGGRGILWTNDYTATGAAGGGGGGHKDKIIGGE